MKGAHTACPGHLLAAILTPHLLHNRLGKFQPMLKQKRRQLKQLSNKYFQLITLTLQGKIKETKKNPLPEIKAYAVADP